ncbi:AraC-type DNA-binding protein [Paenibacillus algorifonticola]|uniref:AraC-type DNA-binding protein n=1 Tax=Paenibacillus algorifonticola TaxID=684063 RepID=A0A1I2D804_9BACL|nr:AraC family transcriptional regulator [Paenibacillus algorifonticola]SFE76682.1 AraC-type DNA-binding protein [Paenibacillus algorifonticola]
MAVFQYNPERPFRDGPDMYLLYWGKEACKPCHLIGPIVRENFKLHFIHKGKGTVKVAGKTYTLTAGQAFLIYPQVLISYESDEKDPWTYSWIGFFGEQAAQIIARTSITPENPVFPMDMKLMPTLYDQLTEAVSHQASSDLRLQAILYEFLSLLVEFVPLTDSNSSNAARKQEAYIHRSMEFLHAHYSERITMEQLAAVLGLDRKYLSFLFKEAVGMPPQQYLLNYRMNKACELLGKGIYSISEVARSVGYQDALLFSKMFKKVKGTPPRNFE